MTLLNRYDCLRPVLAAALFLVLALGAWVDQPRQLLTVSGIIQGASYADVHARMPAALALMIASLAGFVLSVMYATGRWPMALVAAVLFAVFGALAIGRAVMLLSD